MSEAYHIDLPPLPKDSDGRLKGYFGTQTNPALNCERLFCFICGGPAGWTSLDGSKYVRPVHVAATCAKCDQEIMQHYANGEAFPLQRIPEQYLEAFGIRPETA